MVAGSRWSTHSWSLALPSVRKKSLERDSGTSSLFTRSLWSWSSILRSLMCGAMKLIRTNQALASLFGAQITILASQGSKTYRKTTTNCFGWSSQRFWFWSQFCTIFNHWRLQVFSGSPFTTTRILLTAWGELKLICLIKMKISRRPTSLWKWSKCLKWELNTI